MAGELTIEVNNDGTATINFGNGAMHTVSPNSNTSDVVGSLQQAYGDRIGNVVQSGMSSTEQANKNAGLRQNQRDDVLNRTLNGVGLITDTTGDGYSTEDIQRYVNGSDRFGSVEEAVSRTADDGKRILSKYLGADTIAAMTTKQLLAASELNYQGNGDTGRTNGLSVQDLDFIVNKANDFAASVWSPNAQAISTGYDPVATPVITNPGVSQDTRNWEEIIASENPVIAAQIATNQMYGGTYVDYVSGGYQYDSNGDVVLDGLGQPVRDDASLHIVGNNGAIIQKIPESMQNIAQVLQNYGVRDTSWLNGMQQYMSSDMITSLQDYNPYADFGNLWENTYVRSVAESVSPFFDLGKEEEVTPDTGTTTTGTSETGQTITSPAVETVEEATKKVVTPTYEEAPQASDAVPTTPSYTQPATQTTQTGATGTGIYPQTNVTGTMGTPLQSAGISAVPQTITTGTNYTGTNMSNLTSQSQGGFGGIKKYRNQFGQEISVTVDGAGNPLTFVPPGYTAVAEGGLMTGYSKGGLESDPVKSSEDIYLRIAQKVMNFQGDSSELKKQMAANPALAAKLGSLTDALTNMATTRMGAAPGTDVPNLGNTIGAEQFNEMKKNVVTSTMVPPQQAAIQQITPQAADFVPSAAGQAPGQASMAEAATVGTVEQAQMPQMTAAGTMTPTTAAGQVQAETAGLQAEQGTVSPQAQVQGQQQLTSAITGMQAATGESVDVTGAPTRTAQQGEMIQGTGVDQAQVAQAFGTGEAQAASVQTELANLMQQFEGGDTPAWAAGSMRNATAMLAARGLGASSLAGQAVIQAAMEAALPIAQIDAGNKQQMALFKAEQRAKFLGIEFDQAFQAKVMNAAKVSEIANMNFSAEQQVALENSRAANTMNLQNLSNQQAMVMAEAAALSNLDMANLNNRQQAAVQNAQSFLQMDMSNLNNAQQTAMFKAQQNVQALFTDQAAENAAAQFNATSENQTNQFFASLASQTSQFNASQANAMDQFNVNSVNALRQFNAEVQNQRTMFNAQNGLVVAQANAQWRQNLATLNTAAINESNMEFARTMNDLTSTNLDEIWQRERDLLSMAFQVSENNANRANEILVQKIAAQATKDAAELEADLEAEANTGDFIKEILIGISGLG